MHGYGGRTMQRALIATWLSNSSASPRAPPSQLSRWVGRGDKLGADGAAVDAMRTVLSTVPMDGIVVIGEGEKDEAPMLYNGERIGDGSSPQVDVAVDPIDGTSLTALGRANAIAVIAVSDRGSMFDPGPCFYMSKIAVGPDAAGSIDITATPTQNLRWIAKAKGESVRDLTVVILDRPRHEELIAEVRASGARIKLIGDGDIFGAIATAWPEAGVDVLFGVGGTPEGVIAAAALKCMGGEIQAQLWPRSDDERDLAIATGYDVDAVLTTDDLVAGRQRLLRGNRHHRWRTAPRRALQPARRQHAEPGDALAQRHGPPGRRAPPPRQARRLRRRRLQLTSRSRPAPQAGAVHHSSVVSVPRRNGSRSAALDHARQAPGQAARRDACGDRQTLVHEAGHRQRLALGHVVQAGVGDLRRRRATRTRGTASA